MLWRRWAGIFLLVPMMATPLSAQKKDRRFSAFPFPVVYYAPETKFVFGAAGSATFRFRRDSLRARPSVITAGAAYTQNRQVLLYSNFQLFYDRDKYYCFGEAGYYIYSYYFFGTGKDEVPKELYAVDYPRIKLNVTGKVLPHIYIGPGYQYEDYRIKDTATSGALSGAGIPGAHGSVTSGLGAQVLYDSRDTVLYPYHGVYGSLSFMNNGRAWGGNFSFNRWILDVSFYHSLYKNIVLALNSYSSFVTGNAPFQQQSFMGGNRRMRGYYEGRYIDKNLAVLQAEARFPVWRRFGGAVFADAGALGDERQFIRINEPKYSCGAGIRFNVNRKDHLNLRLDYALGPGTNGIYFTIGEAF